MILDLVHNLPDSIANIHLEIARNGEQQTTRDTQMTQIVAGLTSQVTEIFVQGKNSMEIMRTGKARILREVARLHSVLNDLRKLLHLWVLIIIFDAPYGLNTLGSRIIRKICWKPLAKTRELTSPT